VQGRSYCADHHRDAVEIGYAHRFEQYHAYLKLPESLVPRRRR
jgi:N-methylhydantoinase A/oxoprolinase/acetone carboxylase beta subunit